MLLIADFCNPTFSVGVRAGKDAWQHVASNILTPEKLPKVLWFGGSPLADLVNLF